MRKAFLAVFILAVGAVLAAQQPLNNDAIIKMAKAGLSDDVIVTSIQSSPGAYDTSTDGLVALKKAKPGTREFRAALRDALEGIRDLHVSNGVVNMSKNDHLGLDQRARVIVKVVDNKWQLDN